MFKKSVLICLILFLANITFVYAAKKISISGTVVEIAGIIDNSNPSNFPKQPGILIMNPTYSHHEIKLAEYPEMTFIISNEKVNNVKLKGEGFRDKDGKPCSGDNPDIREKKFKVKITYIKSNNKQKGNYIIQDIKRIN